MHALEQRRLAAWKGHSADLKASQQQHTHTHTYAHTAVQCAPVPGAVGARCAVLEFTSDSFCWSLNTSFPFGLCLSPLSLRLLMIGTSMSSVCIFHGRLGSLPPPRIVHTDPVDSSRLHRVRRGGPTPESQVEDLLLLLLLLLRLPPPICLIRCPCSNREGGVK